MPVLIFMSLFVSDSQADWQLVTTQVDIWRFHLNTDAGSISSCLSYEEVERANRFHFPVHQRRFRIARATMRTILGRYLDIKAKDITFYYEKGGKPSVRLKTPIMFNLSHTGDYACLGVGLKTAIGIDIESYSGRNYTGIASHVFSGQEQQHLAQIPPFLLPMAFFSLWSQKEAVIKCNGLGMRYPLQTLSLPIFSPPGYQFIDGVDNQPLQLQRFTPYIATAAAVCTHPDVNNIRFFDWQHN